MIARGATAVSPRHLGAIWEQGTKALSAIIASSRRRVPFDRLTAPDAPFAERLIIPIALILLSFGVRWLAPVAPLPYLFFIPSIMIASFVSGMAPGVVSAATSSLIALFVFLDPRYSLAHTRVQWVATLIYFAISTAIAVICALFRDTLRKRDRDIAALNDAERRLSQMNETLEMRVAEELEKRTGAEEALRQAHKMEAVGQLTGGIAHDFNNLLTGITCNIDLLKRRVEQGRVSEINGYIDAASQAASRAGSLTQRLLAFSRRQTLDPRPTDAGRLVAGMEQLIRRIVGPLVNVDVIASAALWPTLVDYNQLENALLNLCVNARDAMPSGGQITIETANDELEGAAAQECSLDPGCYAVVSVEDTGTGMTPEVVRRAFDPFFTTKPSGEGTGLGLSMVYGFARQSGGQVSITSEVGRGTKVSVYLPRHDGCVALAPASPEPAVRDLWAPRRGTILIIEDEWTVRGILSDVVRDLGCTCLEAVDGPSGLKILQSEAKIDLLITDYALPGGLSGQHLMEAAGGLRPNLRMMLITGYCGGRSDVSLSVRGDIPVLAKPFGVHEATALITGMLDEAQAVAC